MDEPKKTSSTDQSNDEISKGQRDRDRSMRPKRAGSRSKYQLEKTKQLWKLRIAKFLINDLKNYGPVGLVHIEAVSNVIGRPIQIRRSDGHLYRTINGNRSESDSRFAQCPVDVEYHRTNARSIGHWTLPGNRDPLGVEKDLNACLFTVIASQTERRAADLRRSTVDYLSDNVAALATRLDEFLPSVGKEATPLMIGGARYVGTSAESARNILDNSQNEHCDFCRYPGHPRGHASQSDATGPEDSVENYSRTTQDIKSGFLSRSDQDNVAHFALIHKRTREAMETLNRGGQTEAITLTAQELESRGCVLPQMKEWYKGEEYSGMLEILRVTIVLRHHAGKADDPNADVFVHTFYPRNN